MGTVAPAGCHWVTGRSRETGLLQPWWWGTKGVVSLLAANLGSRRAALLQPTAQAKSSCTARPGRQLSQYHLLSQPEVAHGACRPQPWHHTSNSWFLFLALLSCLRTSISPNSNQTGPVPPHPGVRYWKRCGWMHGVLGCRRLSSSLEP